MPYLGAAEYATIVRIERVPGCLSSMPHGPKKSTDGIVRGLVAATAELEDALAEPRNLERSGFGIIVARLWLRQALPDSADAELQEFPNTRIGRLSRERLSNRQSSAGFFPFCARTGLPSRPYRRWLSGEIYDDVITFGNSLLIELSQAYRLGKRFPSLAI